MEELKKDGTFDSYAVLFKKGDGKCFISSDNVNGDTYFDIASMGKILITATLLLKAVGENKLSVDDTLDMYFDDVPKDK